MNNKIEGLWNEMQHNKAEFLSELSSWSDEELSAVTSESQWNALQVIEHVMLSERGTLAYMKKKTSSGWEGIPRATEEHAHSSSMLDKDLDSEKKWKAPEVLPDPRGDKSLTEYSHQWDELRNKYEAFLEGLDEEFYERQVFRHALAGRQNLYHALSFLGKHVNHHSYQIGRIREALGNQH